MDGNLEKWCLWRGVRCGPWKQNHSTYHLILHEAFFYTKQTLPRSMVLPALYLLIIKGSRIGTGLDRTGQTGWGWAGQVVWQGLVLGNPTDVL